MLLQQYKEAIENSNIVSKTDTEGIITFVNEQFCKISGYTKKELLGKNHNIVRHPDVPDTTFTRLWDTIQAKKTYTATVKNQAKDGSVFYVNTTVTPILDEDGNIVEYIAIRYDVTTEKLLQKDLEEKQKLLFLQSRHASLGQMLANIAHQWRQPLTELNLSLFNMKKVLLNHNEENINEYYAQSKQIIKHMSQTIDDFSDFFKPQKNKQLFYLDEAIDDALKILKQTVQNENISIIKHYASVQVDGVSNEFSQVLINLIQNSKDAFIANNINNRCIEIGIEKTHDSNVIVFQDNAGGIQGNILDHLFEPYISTKHASVGTGLGLFMSQMIVQNSLNGMIKVSNKNDGAQFLITIPQERQIDE
ncbi:MAG: PAS domain-containing sensor histidine kinase [Campylobacterota bacterium]|nr:PAS domain-containing sensor histidine kinase [Campylobacterota bacterium]